MARLSDELSVTPWRRIDRYLEGLVPADTRAGGDEDAVRRASVLLRFSAVLVAMSAVWCVVDSLLGLYALVPYIVAGQVLISLVPLTLRRSQVVATHHVVGVLLVILLSMAWLRGKQEAPLMALLALCPLLATMTGGPRTGYVWLAIVGASTLGMALAGRTEAAHSAIPRVWITRPLIIITLSAVAQVCAVVYETMRDRMMAHLQAMHAELAERHARSEGQLHQIEILHNQLRMEHRVAQQAVADLEIAHARAEAASRAKGTFLANVSHEIRTPMNAVLGMTELLLDEPLPAAQRTMAQTILSSGTSLLLILNDVLDMSKIEAGELSLRVAEFYLVELIESLSRTMRVLAEAKGLTLRTELAGLPLRPIRGDDMRLRQVLVNLVGNAIKFTAAGHIAVRVRAVDTSADSVRIHFGVQDTGIGMTAEAAERVFHAFQQADESTTRKFGGTGLGLSISKKLVAMMGSDLTVRSAPEQGSTFEFEVDFPLCATFPMPQKARCRNDSALQLRALSPLILAVEDQDINRVLLQRMLERCGCRVTAVTDGAQAVAELTRDHSFSLVFMDWQMPVMDGLEATAQIRRWEATHGRPHTPIIGFTASAFVQEVETCIQAGMDDVLCKPLVRAQLEQMLYNKLLPPDPA